MDPAPTPRSAAPEGPQDVPRRRLRAVARRVWRESRDDNLTDWAAALTYYGVLSVFPALLALVSILGLIGERATGPLIDNLTTAAPGPAKDIVVGALEGLQRNQGGAGLTFAAGLAGALWAASGYVGAFIRASNVIWDVEEGRPLWKTVPLRVGVTVVTLLLLATVAIAVTLTGPLAREVGDLVGVGSAAVTAWDIAKWPVLLLVVAFLLAILYWAAPNVRHPHVRWVTPGGIIAVVLWVIASAGFAFYVANFGAYNATYGSLGGVVVFLVWLWVSNIALLAGAEVNAELERERQLQAGESRGREPFLPPRDTREASRPHAAPS